jgi:pimeloyl-ACP methyl ester carboxylesterase
LLLLQGQANSHRWWERVRTDLSRTLRTVTFDYRGTGATQAAARQEGAASDAEWSTKSFASDAAAVLDGLGYQQAHVYGTSMGGRVAQMLAVHHSHRLQRLVLACTSSGGLMALERSQAVRRALSQPDATARREALLQLMYTPAWAAQHGRSSTLLGDSTMTSEAARRHLHLSARHDASALLASITAPTLVLHGSDDLMTPAANAALMAEAIPAARHVLIQDGRHGFFEEFSATVTPQVVQFLS